MTATIERTYLTAAETAGLLRAHLKRAFPGVKFSVRTSTYSGGASIRVGWTNGPTTKAVDAIADGYKGSGFDGMIDLKYDYDTYLLPDGTLMTAGTRGTGGSRGSVPGFEVEPPHGATRITTLNDFVFTDRDYDAVTMDTEVLAVMNEFGLTEPDRSGDYIPGCENARTAREAARFRLYKRELPPCR